MGCPGKDLHPKPRVPGGFSRHRSGYYSTNSCSVAYRMRSALVLSFIFLRMRVRYVLTVVYGKSEKGRTFPFDVLPGLRDVLEEQREYTDQAQKRTGKIIPWVFHRNGKPIKDFYGAWRKACEAAGLVGKIPHDFRRTAVRNLERAGVSRAVAMQLVGHETEAIYNRYAIVSESDLRAGVEKLAALEGGPRQVLPFPQGADKAQSAGG